MDGVKERILVKWVGLDLGLEMWEVVCEVWEVLEVGGFEGGGYGGGGRNSH